MTKKALMTTDGTIDHKPFSSVSGGTFVIESLPVQDTDKLKIGGKNVYLGPLKYTFSGGDAVGFVNGSVATVDASGVPVSNEITPGAAGMATEGAAPMRLDDESIMICTGVPISTPPPRAPVPFATVIVATAGQNKMESD